MAEITKIDNGSQTYDIKDAGAARDNAVVKLAGNQAITGVKTFNNALKYAGGDYDALEFMANQGIDIQRIMFRKNDGHSNRWRSLVGMYDNVSVIKSGAAATAMFVQKVLDDGTSEAERFFALTATDASTSSLKTNVSRCEGKAFAAAGMPSSVLVDISMPSSAGTEPTRIDFGDGNLYAPFSCWVSLVVEVRLVDENNGLQAVLFSHDANASSSTYKRPVSSYFRCSTSGSSGSVFVPVKKGQSCYVQTFNGPNVVIFQYAKAEAET